MPRMGVNQYHQVVRKSRLLNIGVFSSARACHRLFQHPIYLCEIEVTEHWRNHPAWRNSLCPGGLPDHLQESHHRCILGPPCYFPEQQRMLHIVTVGPEVQIDDSCSSLDDRLCHSVYRFMS